jgi:IS30 family transposase
MERCKFMRDFKLEATELTRERGVTTLSRQMRQLQSILRRALTWDRGMGLAQHKRLTVGTNVQIYF